MRDPPTKFKQKIKESTAKLLFHSLGFGCYSLSSRSENAANSLIPSIPDNSNTWRSLCEEKFTELVKKAGKTSGFLGTQEHFGS
jgi:hypothetical protein